MFDVRPFTSRCNKTSTSHTLAPKREHVADSANDAMANAVGSSAVAV